MVRDDDILEASVECGRQNSIFFSIQVSSGTRCHAFTRRGMVFSLVEAVHGVYVFRHVEECVEGCVFLAPRLTIHHTC